jgi:hypothetical protein
VTDPQSAPGTGWSIQAQTYKVAPNVSGALVQGTEVSFMTASGVLGTVFIPQAQYTVDNVRANVAAQALVLDQIQNLKG